MIGKVRVLSLLAAGIVFILPWIELRCNGQPFIHQNGFDIIAGNQRPTPEAKKKMDEMMQAGGSVVEHKPGDGLPKSFLVGGAFVVILISFIASIAAIGGTNPKAGAISGLLASIAMALIVVQMAIGFPMERELKQEAKEKPTPMEQTGKSPSDPFDQLATSMAKSMLTIVRLPTLYAEILLLAVPGLLAAVSLRQLQGNEDEDLSVPPAGYPAEDARSQDADASDLS